MSSESTAIYPPPMLDIYQIIQDAHEPTASGLYQSPPQVLKATWQKLGDRVTGREHLLQTLRWGQHITLRLDITGMSNLKKRMQQLGIFSEGFSETFRDMMLATARALATRYGARWTYTQSDEITLVICPTPNLKYQPPRGGKLAKLVSLSAAFASATATAFITAFRLREVTKNMHDRNVALVTAQARDIAVEGESYAQGDARHEEYEEQVEQSIFGTVFSGNMIDQIANDPVLIEFDCRMSCCASEREAFELVLWRAYDCAMNGVTDAACHAVSELDGTVSERRKRSRDMAGLATLEKLQWLEENHKLPLPDHQAYGSLFERVTRDHTGCDPRTGEKVQVSRNVVVARESGNVISMVRSGAIKLA